MEAIEASDSESFSFGLPEQSVEIGQRSILGGEGTECTFEQTRVEELSDAAAYLGGKKERIKEILKDEIENLEGVET
jgi:hypothetical protein